MREKLINNLTKNNMAINLINKKIFCVKLFILLIACSLTNLVFARDLVYNGNETDIFLVPGEPTQVNFAGKVIGGYKSKLSALTIDRKENDIILFAQEGLSETGDAIIVRLQDGRSYSFRIKLAMDPSLRDTMVKIEDGRGVFDNVVEEEDSKEAGDVPYRDRDFQYAPPTTVSGLMREMILVSEFGKKNIAGYRVSERHKGEVILNDGTMSAVIEKIFIGPNLWGYVVNTANQIEQSQKINPATFRIDGTRAILAERWELAPKPMNIEQQIAGADKAKVYIVTQAKK